MKCQRAKALDMEILLDFHYSDWWADPANQNIPASWIPLRIGLNRIVVTTEIAENFYSKIY